MFQRGGVGGEEPAGGQGQLEVRTLVTRLLAVVADPMPSALGGCRPRAPLQGVCGSLCPELGWVEELPVSSPPRLQSRAPAGHKSQNALHQWVGPVFLLQVWRTLPWLGLGHQGLYLCSGQRGPIPEWDLLTPSMELVSSPRVPWWPLQ